MQIGNKEAGVNFKIYSLYTENYLWDFIFTSPKHGISELIKILGFINIGNIIYKLCKQFLSSLNRYIVYTDNFFTNMDLYTALREVGISTIGTTKAGSFPAELLALNGPSDKTKIWGLTQIMSLKRMKLLRPDDVYKRGSRKGKMRDKIDFKNRILEEDLD